MIGTPMSATPESYTYMRHTQKSHAHERHHHENHALESHALESHAHKRYPYKNPFCYSIPPYQWKDPTEPKPAHSLSYRLWWMMLARRTFSRFSEFRFRSFCHSTPPYHVIMRSPRHLQNVVIVLANFDGAQFNRGHDSSIDFVYLH
jgi:hypothetical protein